MKLESEWQNLTNLVTFVLKVIAAALGMFLAIIILKIWHDSWKSKDYHALMETRHSAETIAARIIEESKRQRRFIYGFADLPRDLLTDIQQMRDPWGNPFRIDFRTGYVCVTESGTTSELNPFDPSANQYYMKTNYLYPLQLTEALLEVNPTGEADPYLARDVLHLIFNKPVRLLAGRFRINDWSAPEDHADPSPHYAFRWLEGSHISQINGSTILRQPGPDGTPGAGDADDQWILADEQGRGPCWPGFLPPEFQSTQESLPRQSAGQVFVTDGSLEIILALPAGTSGSIIPDIHYLDLTGSRKNRSTRFNPLFYSWDEISPAESFAPVKICLFPQKTGN